MIRLRRRYLIPLAIVLLLGAVELAIWMLGLRSGGGASRIRTEAVSWAGFWPGLLRDWRPNFAAQPVTMFATYWLIHASPGHLLGNVLMIVLFALRTGTERRAPALLALWFGSVLGGAVAFGLMAQSISPMIGASGGVFGLLGVYVVDDYVHRRRDAGRGAALRSTALLCGAIGVLSLLDYALRDGVLAWQAHLGGFLAGLILTWTLAAEDPARS